MSKFIRTEDGIYLVEEENELYIYCRKGFNRKTFALQENNLTSGCDYIGEHRISENFIELIDEFVYGNNKINGKPLIAQQNSLETKIKIAKVFECDLYGAIWTDKGLIYVAKINEKGEFELI